MVLGPNSGFIRSVGWSRHWFFGGCPPEAAGVSADINAMVSVPSVTPGYPQTLYDRIVARGIPTDVADEISKSKAFWDLVAKRDSLLADF